MWLRLLLPNCGLHPNQRLVNHNMPAGLGLHILKRGLIPHDRNVTDRRMVRNLVPDALIR